MFFRLLLQAGEPTPEEQQAVLIVVFIALLIWLAVAVLVAIFVHRDAKRRGANATAWVLGWLLLSLAGALGWAIFAVLYFVLRPKQILYDNKGNPLLPNTPPLSYGGGPYPYQAPATQGPVAQGWQPAPAQAPNPPPPQAWGTVPAGWQPAPVPHAYLPPPLGAKMSKVKCPRCQTIFEFQAAPVGPTHVKCPACGEEGNI